MRFDVEARHPSGRPMGSPQGKGKKGRNRKGLKLKKAQDRLSKRITAHEESSKRRTDHGRGLRRPGSMKVRSN